MKAAIAGGGTGGHVFPAVAIVEELRRRDSNLQLMYLGRAGSIEERVAGEMMIPFRPIIVEGLPSGNVFKKFRALASALVGLLQSVAILWRFRPQVVIGTGGYASLPPILAASILRIPSVIHEQNCVPGKANRLCSRFADVVTVHFEKSGAYFPVKEPRVVGNPIRSDFLPQRLELVDRDESRRKLGLSPDKFTVFLLGGSRGAHSLNMAMVDALPHLDPRRFQIVWMTGKDDYRWVRASCERAGIMAAVFPFISEMVVAYCAADLAISRAGASTLAELSAVGVPAILVPYPHATDRHQELNARVLVDAGAAQLMMNGELHGETLAQRLKLLSDDQQALSLMRSRSKQFSRPDAAERVVNILFELVF
ncbi:MAG: undecaprenyldiphospho-muramoylpentapeptide beta-N-acetylglucosaminyltransferase [Candidatus Abyssobacteria bacterium SURF_17]|jgi:UDP-N-acetylglucosamine--N-acetylmuramyl-(pentapeptide) pyrophosphoryl-undecaprenol N-acetylglucosamine transferase|uniref:UDP-N-acetylglucosamine--N-acetylmuramyl-(pentapeptide) pyrophosphoryl-undecaprenol N-acetylglucosamine transferase n=1 Tax=Candidatus Abyssobacteria bacterium SURF_17 TaxID=2093361 RepID=A0A419F7P6_9BACT|nr:MAG: undecaprenyldiphospho-muramoylpentapeptide beta-N-acetylglucosaminyltransferase [Candidatus Abyssubacteria bacterium SURF_17]